MAERGFVVTFEKGSVKNIQIENAKQTADDVYNRFDSFFTDLKTDIFKMNLKHLDTDKIFALFGDLVEQIKTLLVDRMTQITGLDETIFETISRNLEFVKARFDGSKTRIKRHKEISSNSCYVPPQEKAIGLKWRTTQSASSVLPLHNMKQTTLQYVPIIDQLKALFSVSAFKNSYFEYNQAHICQPGILENFCC